MDDMLSTPSALISSITSPQGDSSYQNFPHTMEPTIPSITSCIIDSYDARYWQRCTMQSISRQPTRTGPLMVSSPTPNSVGNFRDLSEAFVGQYLCSARHKQNISTLQNIKMQDNESLREFVKRFGQAVLQVEACSMDAVLQIFKRSICPGTPFFESLAKKPPTTMDDLFRRANKYSMLEDDGLSDFKWPRPIGTDPSTRDRSRRCAFHKDHGHTTETCRAFQYLVERLIKAGHLKQYLRSDNGGRDASQHHNPGAPRAPAAPKAVINYINGGPSDEETTLGERGKNLDPTRTLQPHRDALILSLEIGDFDVRRILVDPGSSADLVQASSLATWDTVSQASKTLDESFRIQRVFNYILGRHCTAGPSTQSLSTYIR
ncbi:hypothetical protein CK203_097385 [Vitis vinifera]|uniref:Retrotransposon gag domain-containing protein n=1 Tax=Vitis vinifera TaxID=29760 RepID=A0A438EXK3_VITVI|nr:hypothetical protein CK203_097385 [Vitis vinifera]